MMCNLCSRKRWHKAARDSCFGSSASAWKTLGTTTLDAADVFSNAFPMNYDSDIYPPTRPSGRVMNSFGQDLESVAFAVLSFLSGGVLLFLMCFVVTKCMQCYKARIRRKKRQAMGEDDDDELENAVMSGAFQAIEDEEETRLVDL